MELKIHIKPNVEAIPVVIYLIAIAGTQLLMSNEQVSILLQLIIGMFCYIIVVSRYRTHFVKKWIAISIVFSLLMIVSLIYNGNSQLYHLLYIWGRIGGALLFYYSDIKEETVRAVFYVVSIIFIVMAVTGAVAGDVLLGTSRNGINSMIIFYAICCYIAHKDKKSRALPYSYSVIAFVVSLWSEGRSGVIVTAGMVIIVVLYNFFLVKRGKIQTLIIFAILLSTACWFSYKYFIHYILEIADRFEARGFGSSRFDLWAEYARSLKRDYLNVFFGSTTANSDYYYMRLYKGNLHNAFLLLHSKFGIVGFALVVLSIIKSALVFIKSKKMNLFFSLIIIVARGMFDWIAFPGYYDFLFALLFMYCLKESSYKCDNKHYETIDIERDNNG